MSTSALGLAFSFLPIQVLQLCLQAPYLVSLSDKSRQTDSTTASLVNNTNKKEMLQFLRQAVH